MNQAEFFMALTSAKSVSGCTEANAHVPEARSKRFWLKVMWPHFMPRKSFIRSPGNTSQTQL
jgi:hypothetical protein